MKADKEGNERKGVWPSRKEAEDGKKAKYVEEIRGVKWIQDTFKELRSRWWVQSCKKKQWVIKDTAGDKDKGRTDK